MSHSAPLATPLSPVRCTKQQLNVPPPRKISMKSIVYGSINRDSAAPVAVVFLWLLLLAALTLSSSPALAQSPPGSVSSITLTRADGTVTADWPAVAEATKYHVTYTTDGGASWHAPVDDHMNVATNSLTFKADNAKTYIVGVRAGNADGWGDWTNSPASDPYSPPDTPTPPGSVSSITLTRADGTVTADWPAVAEATKYHVTYTTDGGASWHAPVNDHMNVATNTLTFPADNAKTYIVGVRAGNDDGWSDWTNSPASNPYTPPGTPTPPGSVSSITLTRADGTVTADWPAVSEATKYHVTYTTDGGASWHAPVNDHMNVATNSLTFTADNTQTYIVGVRAGNADGWSDWTNSPASDPYSSPAPLAPPGTPASVTLTRADGTVTANWPAVSGATKYHVTYSTDGGASWHAPVNDHMNVATSPLTFTADNAKTYIVGVRAGNDNGWSDWTNSPASNAYTSSAPPDTPASVTLTRADGTVTANWPAVSEATRYHVTYSTDGGTSWHAPVKDNANVSTNTLTFTADNAKPYIVGVRAGNDNGWSDWTDSPAIDPYVAVAAATAQSATIEGRLSLDVLSLAEGDSATDITVTATLREAATADTTITLALPSTRPTSSALLPGLTLATQGATDDYTTTFVSTTHTITISSGNSSGTTTFSITPTTDKATEGTETIIITDSGTGLTPTEVYLEDGPYVAFPQPVYTHVYYYSETVSITVPAVTGAVGTVTYSMSKTREAPAAAPDLTFTAATRALAGTAHSADARTHYTITATDDMGTTTGPNASDDDKTATTIVSVNVIQNQCGTPTGWHPVDENDDTVTPTAALIKDCNILLAVEAALTSNDPLNWATTTSISNWYHVTLLNHARVSRLIFTKRPYPPDWTPMDPDPPDLVLEGSIPPVLGGLTKLRDLEFRSTGKVNGAIPPELGSLPELTKLYLLGNTLSGAIPKELAGLADLRTLDIAENQLSGAIPKELGGLTSLTWLNLPGNTLSGALPWELGKLDKLGTMILHRNQLSGALPPRLDRLTRLETLRLDESNFTAGPVPYLTSTKLKNLGLNDTNRTGSLPWELGTLTKLTSLTLHDNQLTGAIPEEFKALTQLTSLTLADNQLTGAIPSGLKALTQLMTFTLENNQLTGAIPSELKALTELKTFTLDNNQLTGAIPDLSALVELRTLTLGHNNFDAGSLPTWLTSTTFTKLKELDLRNTNRTGTFPDLSALDELVTLTLDGNQLTGAIPIPTGSLTKLPSFGASGIFYFDYNESACLPTGLDDEWYYKRSFFGQDAVEVHCAYSQPKAPALTSGSTSLTLNWTAYSSTHTDDATDPSPSFTVSDYEVQYRQGTTGQWTTVPHVANTHPTTDTTYQITGLTTGAFYQARYRARATHATDTNRFYGTRWSGASTLVPGVELTAKSITTTSATLKIAGWTDAWWYQSHADGASCSDKVSAGTATAPLSGLTPSTNYIYTAYGDANCSSDQTLATTDFRTATPQPTGGRRTPDDDDDDTPPTSTLESPTQGDTVSGVDIIRGWSFTEEDGVEIAEVELYIDRQRVAFIPCCSARPDVAEEYAHFSEANATHSGWGITLNWGVLSAGRHTVQVVATTTDGGRWESELHTVRVVKPGGIAYADRFSLAEAEASLDDEQLVLSGVVIGDEETEQEIGARYAWRESAQGLRLEASRLMETARAQPLGVERLLAGVLRWGWGLLSPGSVTATEGITAVYEAPADRERVAGIGFIRGWAFPDNGQDAIATITVQIDDTIRQSIPCCSTRPDVAREYPEQANPDQANNAKQSGWGLVYNYGELPEGEHTITVRMTTEAGLVTSPEARTVTVSRLGGYTFVDQFDLSQAEVDLVGEEIILSGVEVRDSESQETQEIEVRLQWSREAQGLVIVDTETMP